MSKPFSTFFNQNILTFSLLHGNIMYILIRSAWRNWQTHMTQNHDPAIFDAYFSFIVSGCVGLVQYWLKTGMKETPQQLARLTEQVIRKGIGVLDTDPFADIENVRS